MTNKIATTTTATTTITTASALKNKNKRVCYVICTVTETQVLSKGGRKLQIQVYGQQLTQVDKFVYLGGSISTNGTEEDVTRRVGLARGNFQTMNNVWTSKDISKATKLQVYETMILSMLLYNSETWTLKTTQ